MPFRCFLKVAGVAEAGIVAEGVRDELNSDGQILFCETTGDRERG